MRLLKLVFSSIIILFILASLMGLLLPSHVLVSRAVNVNRYRDSIMPYMNDINQWKSWMEGMGDSSVVITSPTQAKLGHSQVSINTVTDSTVISLWTGRNGDVQTATMYLIGSHTQPVTVVQWQFEQELSWYPWERLGSMMNDKILGTMMEKNLSQLKTMAEKR
jgi:thiamine kinase-like enzyme